MDLSIEQLILAIIAFLIIVAVHGFAYAATARLLGCRVPQHNGQLTLNPIVHLDLLGILGGILFYLGWSKPVPIAPAQIRFGIWGIVLCVLASLAAVVVLAVVALFVRYPIETLFSDTVAYGALAVINATSSLAIWFALFNLIPLPPLAAGQILLGLWPRLRTLVDRHQWQTSLVMLVLAAIIARAPFARPVFNTLSGLVVPFSAWLGHVASQLTQIF